jgi:hypothetical protein
MLQFYHYFLWTWPWVSFLLLFHGLWQKINRVIGVSFYIFYAILGVASSYLPLVCIVPLSSYALTCSTIVVIWWQGLALLIGPIRVGFTWGWWQTPVSKILFFLMKWIVSLWLSHLCTNIHVHSHAYVAIMRHWYSLQCRRCIYAPTALKWNMNGAAIC